MEIMPVAAHPVASGQIHRVRPLSDHQRRRRSSTSLSSSSSTTTTTTTTLDVAPVVPFALLLPSGPETSTSRQRTATQEASSNVGRVGRSRSRRRKQKKSETGERGGGEVPSGVTPSLFATGVTSTPKLSAPRGKLRKGASRGLRSRPQTFHGNKNNGDDVESSLSMSIHQIR